MCSRVASALRISAYNAHSDALAAENIQAHQIRSCVCIEGLYTRPYLNRWTIVEHISVILEVNSFQIMHPQTQGASASRLSKVTRLRSADAFRT